MNTPFMNANRATLRNCEIQVYTVTRDNDTEAGEPRCFHLNVPSWVCTPPSSFFQLLSQWFIRHHLKEE
jgi:hypothetical protein